jgi:hypothetical protein
MSRELLFLYLYGMLALSAAFLAAFWGWFAYKRHRALEGRPGLDRYFLLSAGLALDAIGGVFVFGTRVAANIHYGLSKALTGWEGLGIAVGLLMMLCAKVLLVWLADLEREPPVWTWLKWMGVFTILWGVAAVLFAGMMPEADTRVIPG